MTCQDYLEGSEAEWAPGTPLPKRLGITHSASSPVTFRKPQPRSQTASPRISVRDRFGNSRHSLYCMSEVFDVMCEVLHELNATSEASSQKEMVSSVCSALCYLCGKSLTPSHRMTSARHTVLAGYLTWQNSNTVVGGLLQQLLMDA